MAEQQPMSTGKKIGRCSFSLIGCGGTLFLLVLISLFNQNSGIPAPNLSAPGTASPAPVPPPAPVKAISAVALNRDYKRNEVLADENWKGRTVEVTGRVSRITKDFMGTIHVHLAVSEFGLNDVDCELSDGYKDWASRLNKGDSVKIRGKVTGMVMSTVGITAEP